MSIPKLIAILMIFLCAAAGWFILGASVVSRTRSSDEQLAAEIKALPRCKRQRCADSHPAV